MSLSLKELLEKPLIETKNLDFTISELFIVIIILISTKLLLWTIQKIFKKRQNRIPYDKGKMLAIFKIVQYFVWIAVILITLDTLGLNITVLIAGSTALFVGLGLGLQQTFQDIVSGIILLMEGTFLVGDVVELQNGEVGKVLEIGLRTSKIETRDNIIMIVPNSKLISDNVINWSHLEKRTRFRLHVGVSYGSDPDQVRRLLEECAKKNKDIAKSPVPFARFIDFGDSSLDFELCFWTTNTFLVENIKSDLRFEIFRTFKANKVQIPFPQRDVHFYPKGPVN
jgi:small-conductance mechanosensitive channel